MSRSSMQVLITSLITSRYWHVRLHKLSMQHYWVKITATNVSRTWATATAHHSFSLVVLARVLDILSIMNYILKFW